MDELINYDTQPYHEVEVQHNDIDYYASTLFENSEVYMESQCVYCDENNDGENNTEENSLIESVKDDISFSYGDNPCFSIRNSYLITRDEDMMEILEYIRGLDEYQKLKDFGYNRTPQGEFIEWKGHNILYDLGIYRSQTCSVDIDQCEPMWRRLIYMILSLFF